MSAWFRERYLDLLGSIYIYNEHRGYTAIEALAAAVKARWPDDHELISVRARRRSLPLRNDGVTVNEQKLEPQTVATLEPAGPGAVRQVHVRLGKGTYEIFCNMAGHYMGGMRAFFVVT